MSNFQHQLHPLHTGIRVEIGFSPTKKRNKRNMNLVSDNQIKSNKQQIVERAGGKKT